MLVRPGRLMKRGGGSLVPSWVLAAGGVPANFDADFVNARVYNSVSSPQVSTPDAAFTDSRTSAGYYQNADGTLTFFPSNNTLRYGTNGLLVEEARTNLILQSQTLNTTWTKSSVSVSSDVVNAPDGAATADKIADDATTNNHQLFQSATVTNAAIYTWSFYAKAAEYTWARLDAEDSTVHATWFNLSGAGSVGTNAAGNTPTITALSNGWYHCTVTRSVNQTTAFMVIGAATADNITSWAGAVGSGIYLWGLQLELGAFPTSYIPTTTTSAARMADAVTFSSIPAVITTIATSAGTLYLQYPSTGLNGPRYFDFGNNSPASFKDSATTNSYFDGSNLPAGVAENSAGVLNKLARSWSGANVNSVINGGSNSATSWDGNWNISTPAIGSLNAGTSTFMNGYLRRLAAWNSEISTANKQVLTT